MPKINVSDGEIADMENRVVVGGGKVRFDMVIEARYAVYMLSGASEVLNNPSSTLVYMSSAAS